jgi:hypothetical protein
MRAADVLIHSANVLLLASYSVRSFLWLRLFAVASALAVIPYYLLQQHILWPPVLWSLVFTAINLYQIVLIYLERRPVLLSMDEQKLYDFGFHSLRPRDFVSLLLIGEWKDAIPGTQLLAEGERASSVCISIAGEVEIRQQGRIIGLMAPGRLIGTALALTDNLSSVSASFCEPGRYIQWPLSNLLVFLNKKPEIRTTVQALVNRDLAEKVEVALRPGGVGSL